MNNLVQIRPSLPLPAPLRGADLGTYAHPSVVTRLPDIGRQMLAANSFQTASQAALEQLIDGIPTAVIRPLTDLAAPDIAQWNSHIAPYEGQNWLDIPWFFAETYFYRRILEATGYFIPDHPHHQLDPFEPTKQEGLTFGRSRIQALLEGVDDLFIVERAAPAAALARLISLALWGNQADLSLWSAAEGDQPRHDSKDQAAAHTLVDNTAEIVSDLMARKAQQVDVILDNAGFELMSDLSLADFLLFSGTAETVRWHMKIHPTFVSDATIADVHQTVSWLKNDRAHALSDLGFRLQTYLKQGRWQLVDHPFWTSPLPMWQMPEKLYDKLGRSDLIITKGDANYRRLLGDRHWPYTTSFDEIVSYAPAPLLALRTIKSEVAAGLTAEQIQRLHNEDPEWLINGRWGLIQYREKK